MIRKFMTLISKYIFNDNANDSLGNFHGVPININYEKFKDSLSCEGKIAIFNGLNSEIILQQTNVLNNFSVEFWFSKHHNNTGNEQIYVQDNYNNTAVFEIISNGNKVRYGIWDGLNYYQHFINEAINDGKMRHYVFTRENSIVSGYLNSTLNFTHRSINLEIGNYYPSCRFGNANGEDRFLNGKLADFRIYDHALTQEEVTAHYLAEKPLEPTCQFRPDDAFPWRRRFGAGFNDVNVTTITGDKSLSDYTDLEDSGQDFATFTGAIDTAPETEAADGLYLIHQTQGSESLAEEHNWELNWVKNGQWQQKLTRNYVSGGSNKAQIVRGLECNNLTIEAGQTLSVNDWDGEKGGIGLLFVRGTLTVNGTLSALGSGFRGGAGAIDFSAWAGEAAQGASVLSSSGSNNYAGGGGGHGNAHDGWAQSTGGGGGHSGAGGIGSRAEHTSNYQQDGFAGVGGLVVGQSDLRNIYFGGGGGGGSAYKPSGQSWRTGGRGGNSGGILIIIAKKIVVSDTGTITSAGETGQLGADTFYSGAGGGGAGGSVMILANNSHINTNRVLASGGAGGKARRWGGDGGKGRIFVASYTQLSGQSDPVAESIMSNLYRLGGEGANLLNMLD